MLKTKTILAVAALTAAIVLGGCQTTGNAIQGVGNGVGGVFNKTGRAVSNLGR